MENEESTGNKVAKAVGGLLAEFVAEVGVALLQFMVLGVLMVIALGLFFVHPGLGIGFGMVSFIVWMYKTGWIIS